jgi:hypothetical protein
MIITGASSEIILSLIKFIWYFRLISEFDYYEFFANLFPRIWQTDSRCEHIFCDII